MASKRPHPQGPMDHLTPKAEKGEHNVPEANSADQHKHLEQAHQMEPNMGRRQDGDRSKRLPVDVDADSSRGDPPHGYGTEAPQVQGGGKR